MTSRLAALLLAATAAAVHHDHNELQHAHSELQLRSMGNVAVDPEPLELDYSHLSPFQHIQQNKMDVADTKFLNPKNGTPWFRFKPVDGRGEAGHEHFDGLKASGDFDYDILQVHNVVRTRVGLPSLQWSNELTDLASRRVHKLSQHGCYIRHSPLEDRWNEAGFRYVGENLYKVINMVPTGVDIGDAWYAEIQDYTYGSVGQSCVKTKCANRQSPPCMLGHFTQMMWEKTTHVGCARQECPDQKQRTFVVVCNYGPGGNIVGNLPFAVKPAMEMNVGSNPCELGLNLHTSDAEVEETDDDESSGRRRRKGGGRRRKHKGKDIFKGGKRSKSGAAAPAASALLLSAALLALRN